MTIDVSQRWGIAVLYQCAESRTWADHCEHYLWIGDLAAVDTLLLEAPAVNLDLICFYYGQLAVVRATYEAAARHFHAAMHHAQLAGNQASYHRSLIWLAYAHNYLGRYNIAQQLLDRVEQMLAPDSLLHAELSFVRGLVAGDVGSRIVAQHHFEQARDLAILQNLRELEARCCANLAPIYHSLGLVDRAGHAIRRVEEISHAGAASPRLLMQVRNINIHRFRIMGDLNHAISLGLPLPALSDDGARHFRGWLALSTAAAATDNDQFELAEQAWLRASEILSGIQDNHLTAAELLWERAWLDFRQAHLHQATATIQTALEMIASTMDLDHHHAYTIKAIIDLEQGDLALVSRYLLDACDGFRKGQHYVGLASTLLHVAGYHLQAQHPRSARKALAEAFGLLRRYQLYGAYYWHPRLMIDLCLLAIREDWGDYETELDIRRLSTDQETLFEDGYGLDSYVKEQLGDFAATLAARRLAKTFWRSLTTLLADERPQVRRRGAQILLAANHPDAYVLLMRLEHDLDPGIRAWWHKYVASVLPQSAQPSSLTVRSFGSFEVFKAGAPWRSRTTSTRKTKALFGTLLLMHERGMAREDLMLLLWPELDAAKQGRALDVALAALRTLLRETIGDGSTIKFRKDTRRYVVQHQQPADWWDWVHLRQIYRSAQKSRSVDADTHQAQSLYHRSFMDDFFALLPQPPSNLTHWNSILESIQDAVMEHQADADEWMWTLGASLISPR